jgi:hypothetical protein
LVQKDFKIFPLTYQEIPAGLEFTEDFGVFSSAESFKAAHLKQHYSDSSNFPGLKYYTSGQCILVIHGIRRTMDTVEKTRIIRRIRHYKFLLVPWIKGNGQRGFKMRDLHPKSEEKNYQIGRNMLLEDWI